MLAFDLVFNDIHQLSGFSLYVFSFVYFFLDAFQFDF